MKLSNCKRIRLLLVGFVAAILLGGGSAKADFTFGEPVNLGPTVNGDSFDQKPCISADGLSLYFASDRPGGYDEAMDDIWLSTRPTKDDPWGPPENLGPVVNSEVGEFHPSITGDELELYFERFENGTGSNIYNLSIWMTKRASKNAAWEQPVKLDLTVPAGYMAAAPSISSDGLELYFSVLRFGDEPQSQLHVTKRQTRDAPWGEPASLGPVVNSWSSQVMPAISNDGLLLLFNDWWADSPRTGGFGNDDIWFTRRATKDGSWSEPVNAGVLINTAGWDWCGAPSADGSTLYFSSDRPGGHEGVDDLWQAPIIPIVDLNADGIVDSADMCIVVNHWGEDYSLCDVGPMPWGDGVVDVQDLIVIAEHLFEEIPATEPVQ
jgi:Tol biopolymer transport system component